MSALLRANAVALPLRDESVDLIVTSPPYFALRSYQDDGEHYGGQIGSEATPIDFLVALWAVMDECWRVLKPTGSVFVNLGDKYAGSGGHNNAAISTPGNKHAKPGRVIVATAERRNAPSSYNKAADGARAKSLMGLPWRFALGCFLPDLYRRPFDVGADCWHEEGCTACRPDHPQSIARAEIVWSKPNGLPESVTDRVRRSHEQWFHFTKEPRYFSSVDEVREPQQIVFTAPQNGTAHHKRAMDAAEGHHRYDVRTTNPLGKVPGSVWTVATEPLIVPDYVDADHFAAYPQEWPRRLILGWSPSGICVECGEGRRPVVERDPVDPDLLARRGQRKRTDAEARPNTAVPTSGLHLNVTSGEYPKHRITGTACACPTPTAPTRPAVVLDPFAGTGTTVGVARALGRFGIGVDLSADYLRLARWRVWQSGHFAKTRERTNREAQTDLFGGAA